MRDRVAFNGNVVFICESFARIMRDRVAFNGNVVFLCESFVEPAKLCGSNCWRIVFRGEDVLMYFATKEEAEQMLWMLENRKKAEAMLKSKIVDSAVPFFERFKTLRKRRYDQMLLARL